MQATRSLAAGGGDGVASHLVPRCLSSGWGCPGQAFRGRGGLGDDNLNVINA